MQTQILESHSLHFLHSGTSREIIFKFEVKFLKEFYLHTHVLFNIQLKKYIQTHTLT